MYGLQHILTMYGGVIAPPLIVGGAAGLTGVEIGLLVSAALFVSGAATLLQTLGIPYFGAKLPLVQGISFASVSTMVAVASGPGGLRSIFGAIMIAGVIGLLISPFFCKIVRYFPAVVTGSIITVIGISLLPVAVRWAMGGNAKAPDWGSMSNIGLAGFSLFVVLLVSRLVQGTLSRLSILIGIVVGTAFAALIGKADFGAVGKGAIFELPQVFSFGTPLFQIGAIISMTVVILVIMTETTADILAVGEIVGTKVDARRVGDGLRADMLATTVAPVFGTFPASAFAQNVGLVAITGIKSRYVVAAGGSVLFALGLFPSWGGGGLRAAARPRRCGHRPLRFGGSERYPDTVQGVVRRQPQPGDRRGGPGVRCHSDRGPGVLLRLSGMGAHRLRLGHQRSEHRRGRAEHPVQRDQDREQTHSLGGLGGASRPRRPRRGSGSSGGVRAHLRRAQRLNLRDHPTAPRSRDAIRASNATNRIRAIPASDSRTAPTA